MANMSWPQVLSLRGTVLVRVWFKVLIMVVYTTAVIGVFHYYDLYEWKDVPNDLDIFQVLGIVTALMLAFRTNTAYDRYYEGRKLWSELVNNIRIITRTVWVMVDDKRDTKLLVGKISLLNLLVAFPYATKHYLREEYSYEEDDLQPFISHLQPLLTPSSNEPLDLQEKLSAAPTEVALKHIRSKMSKEARVKAEKKDEKKRTARRMFGSEPYLEKPIPIASNIPLEISCFISSYIMSCKEKNLIDSPTCRILDTAVANMVRCLTGFERIRRTPIPFAYSVHLQQITWALLLLLPFQWSYKLRWFTIPAVAFGSFALFGILAIGREIENPFGYDYNDLNLEDFCKTIHKEVMSIISQPMPSPEIWLFSEKNHPIITDLSINAEDLTKMKYDQIHYILSGFSSYKFFHPSPSTPSNNDNSSTKPDNLSQTDRRV